MSTPALATYKLVDKNGRTLFSVEKVLGPVVMTGLKTSNASHIVEVASTDGCYPGMAVFGDTLPHGCFIHAVMSATKLSLLRGVWNATTTKFTVSPANAFALVTDATGTFNLTAGGYNPWPVPYEYATGVWRNSLTATGILAGLLASGTSTTTPITTTTGPAMALPTYADVAPAAQAVVLTKVEVRVGDEALPPASIAKRHDMQPFSAFVFVQQYGFISTFPAKNDVSVIASSLTPAVA